MIILKGSRKLSGGVFSQRWRLKIFILLIFINLMHTDSIKTNLTFLDKRKNNTIIIVNGKNQ